MRALGEEVELTPPGGERSSTRIMAKYWLSVYGRLRRADSPLSASRKPVWSIPSM